MMSKTNEKSQHTPESSSLTEAKYIPDTIVISSKSSNGKVFDNGVKTDMQPIPYIIKPTSKRYFILLMYCLCSIQKNFQWIHLSSIANKVSLYYGVDHIAVNWTSALFMITCIPLILPTSWLIERIGLRRALLIGSSGVAIGAIIKCFSVSHDRFYLIIIGQIFVSLSDQFLFCVPSRLASVWFPDNQVSLATGFGIFGNQCGVALGFLLPEMILDGHNKRSEIGNGLYKLFCGTAIVTVITFFILLILFDDTPKYVPGKARLRKMIEEKESRKQNRTFREEMHLFGRTFSSLLRDFNCDLLAIAYGLNLSIGYAIQELLNQMILASKWKNTDEVVGAAGLVFIVAGMIGALFWSHLCDKTHRYMLINKILYIGAIISVILFGFTLTWHNPWLLFGASAMMGFNIIGHSVAALDTAVELTYPIPELVSTSVMNLSPQIVGIPIIFLSSTIVDSHKSIGATSFFVVILIIGLVITFCVRERLNRQNAVSELPRSRNNSIPVV